jgi:hypothetical protein
MRFVLRSVVTLALLVTGSPAVSQVRPTIRVPMCLQYPDSKTYVPCTGMVPVDKTTGEPLDWTAVFKGSPSDPIYTQETTRRTHWAETSSPLSAGQQFTGVTHDDGGAYNGGSTRSTSFSCFAVTDQSGTLSIQGSDNASNWVTFQSRPLVPDTGTYLVQPLFTRYWRCVVVNGGAAQGSLVVKSAFGM